MAYDGNLPLDPRDFDWSSAEAEKQTLRRLQELAKKASCASYHEVVESYSDLFARLPELKKTLDQVLRECELPADSLLSSANISGFLLLDNPSSVWLFLQNQHLIDWDCEAIEISLDNRCMYQDGWAIVSRTPLLLRSMFGAVEGFKKADTTTMALRIVDGDTGWD